MPLRRDRDPARGAQRAWSSASLKPTGNSTWNSPDVTSGRIKSCCLGMCRKQECSQIQTCTKCQPCLPQGVPGPQNYWTCPGLLGLWQVVISWSSFWSQVPISTEASIIKLSLLPPASSVYPQHHASLHSVLTPPHRPPATYLLPARHRNGKSHRHFLSCLCFSVPASFWPHASQLLTSMFTLFLSFDFFWICPLPPVPHALSARFRPPSPLTWGQPLNWSSCFRVSLPKDQSSSLQPDWSLETANPAPWFLFLKFFNVLYCPKISSP